MLGRDDLVWAMALECDIAKHLFGKLPRENWEATLSYRPTANQRSTLELLRYLSYCGIGSCRTCVEGSWDSWQRLVAQSAQLDADAFPAAMDQQKREIAEILAPVTDQELATRTARNPLGRELPLGRALYEMPIRWLVGYRMQLFLYARSLGAEVETPDCW